MVEFSILYRNLNKQYAHPDGSLIKGKTLLKRAEKAIGLVRGSSKDLPFAEAAKQAKIDGEKMQKWLNPWVLV